jgi:signal transduction histidine kinase
MRSIVDGGMILASSLECEKTFPELAEFIVSRLAHSCVIVVREGNQLVRMAAAHSIPFVPEPEHQPALNRVINTGRSEIATSPASRIIAAIPMRNKIAGAIVAASFKPNAFNADDLQLFEVLGRRAGVALESAQLYRETQQANQLKDEFVALISHELRTPLTPILGGVYMMRSETQDRRVIDRALDLIERSAKTQVKIIDDLLDVSRALSGKLRLDMKPVDLSSVITAAVETLRPAIDAKDIHVNLHLSPIKGIVLGDAERLQQVVWNLLSNSVKFTPKAGLIVVELVESAGQAEIRVSDTGVGIEAEYLPFVFERFRDADASRARPHGGLGIGLAIVRHLVESHGGTVQADSSGGDQGSTFVVRLPLRSAAAQKATATE